MGDRLFDPRIDAYIAARAAFARPILTHIRSIVHAASPAIGEAVKWGMPFSTYKGKNLCNMAAFKAHAALGFWQGRRMEGSDDSAMGRIGRLTSIADLPDDAVLAAMIAQVMARIDAGPPARAARPAPRTPLPVPPELEAAIAASRAATTVWTSFTPGKIRDYVEWIGEAKQPATRERRVAQAVAWITEGKARNWQYAKR